MFLCVAGFWQYLVGSGSVSIAMFVNASSRTVVFMGERRCLLGNGGRHALSYVPSPISRFPLSRSSGELASDCFQIFTVYFPGKGDVCLRSSRR